MTCGHEWVGFRILWNPKFKRKMRFDAPDDYGMTECELEPWDHIYVEWVNWPEIREYLGVYWKE